MNITQFLKHHPNLDYAADLRAICAPLALLDIDYFSQVEIDQENQMSALSSNPEFFKLYFNKGYHQFDLHMADTQLGEKHIIWDLIERKAQSQELHADFMGFKHGHTFSIVFQTERGKSCYHFATRLNYPSMNGRYLQIIDQLKLFINYFKEKVANHKQLASAQHKKIRLDTDRGGYLVENRDMNLALFQSSIQANRTYPHAHRSYITKRELECLYWLGLGKSLAEAAVMLGITERTIKAHIKSAKEKLQCDNQFQLGMQYAKL